MDVTPVIRHTLTQDVKKNLKDYIFTRNKEADMKLPAEAELADMFGVSRITIRRVLDELETEGLIIRIHGKGTFINRAALMININLAESYEYSKIIEKSGFKSENKVLDVRTKVIDSRMAPVLGVSNQEKIEVFECIFYADRYPAIYSIDCIPHSSLHKIPERSDWESNSFFTVIYNHGGIVITSARTDFSAVTKDEMKKDTSRFKLMKNDALLRAESVAFDQKYNPVMYGRTFYDTSIINFSLIRTYL